MTPKHALGIGEAFGFAAELFEENAILFLEEFDDGLLVSVHPTGDGHRDKRPRLPHGRRFYRRMQTWQDWDESGRLAR